MGLAQIAREAAYEADAPKREAEEHRRREREEHDALITQEATEMLAKARRKLKRTFGVDASNWRVVEKHPTYVVLREPKEGYARSDLTLTVTTWGVKGNGSRVLYAPHENWGKNYTNNRHGDGLDWHCGPEVTDELSLGRAIQEYEAHLDAIHQSMPDYLP